MVIRLSKRLVLILRKLNGFARDYTQMVLGNDSMQEWVNAGKLETHVIDEDEV